MSADRRIQVVTSTGVREGRCRDCRARILWVITASRPGHPARHLPFDAPRPWPLSTERNDETGTVCEWWPAATLHLATCRSRDPRRQTRQAGAR